MEIIYTSYLILIVISINLILSFFTKSNVLYCGLIGFSGITKPNVETLQLITTWNSLLRGTDSIGVFTPDSGISKSTLDPFKFIKEDQISKYLDESLSCLIHVRKSSVGVNNIRNCHPFKFNNIIGAHNGTLVEYDDLAKKYDIPFSSYFVDSEVIINAFSKDIRDNKLDVLGKFKGAATLLMYDDIHEVFYVYKDSGRPLFYASDNSGNMYISSISEPLEYSNLLNITTFEDDFFYVIKDGIIVHKEEISSITEISLSKPRVKVASSSSFKKGFMKSKKLLNGNDYTGIAFSSIGNDISIESLIGYHAVCTNPIKNLALEVGKQYLITNATSLTKEIQVKEGLRVYWEDFKSFSYINIIPTPGKQVMATHDIFCKDEVALIKGEIVTVISHNFTEDTVLIRNSANISYWVEKKYLKIISNEVSKKGKISSKSINFNIMEVLKKEINV